MNSDIKLKMFDTIIESVGEAENIHDLVIQIQDLFEDAKVWEESKKTFNYRLDQLEIRSQEQIKLINKCVELLNEFASSYKNREKIRRAGFQLDDDNKLRLDFT